MKKITVSDWNLTDEIETGEDVIGILKAALEENDPDFLLSVLSDIAHSKGMTHLAKELHIDQAELHKALASEGTPSFITIFKLFDSLGLQFKIEQKGA
ncbi:MAG: putative addiction module antidote protein [Leptospirales bacterium]|nr:putative addiction module antidote protein [Leptospirales bacterium]